MKILDIKASVQVLSHIMYCLSFAGPLEYVFTHCSLRAVQCYEKHDHMA